MRYFNSSWQEVDELPDDAVLLVRSVGLKHVDMTNEALMKHTISYFTAAVRKDDVGFYVQKERRDEVERLVKEYFSQRQNHS